jgi:cell division protein FtsB
MKIKLSIPTMALTLLFSFATCADVESLTESSTLTKFNVDDYASLKTRMKILEDENHRLTEQVAKITDDKKDALDILDKVNSFYTSSFSSLQNILLSMIALVGVILPVLISFYQTRRLKLESEGLERRLISEFSSNIVVLENRIKNEQEESIELIDAKFKKTLNELMKENEGTFDIIRSESKALVFHTIASIYAKDNYWSGFLKYALRAAYLYAISKSEANLQRIVTLIKNKLNSDIELKNDLIPNAQLYDDFVRVINENDKDGVYSEDIDEIVMRWNYILEQE